MLKKVAYGVVAASLVLAAQVAPADDTQFWTGETYQGVSALPFDAFSNKAEVRSDAMAPEAAPRIERLVPQDSAMQVAITPETYDSDTGSFN
jgi:hypothetical protein